MILNFLNYFLNKFTAYNLRYAISKYIKKGTIDLNQDYHNGLTHLFKKNIEIFISICNSNNINVIPCKIGLIGAGRIAGHHIKN